jgi:hypothetical protein
MSEFDLRVLPTVASGRATKLATHPPYTQNMISAKDCPEVSSDLSLQDCAFVVNYISVCMIRFYIEGFLRAICVLKNCENVSTV